MSQNPYSLLLEPVNIGPKTARNRFYQVPHCNGMGHRWPRSMAAMRGVKAEGGWAVVCTEECEIHPSSDLSGFTEMRLWDDSDIPTHELMTRAVHEHGALAGLQLAHNGLGTANRYTRSAPLSPSGGMSSWQDPIQTRAMSKKDIKTLRGWYRQAAIRGRQAGYDIIYVYAAHDMTILMHFLQTRYNRRTDEYGGSLRNRVRLLREVLEETKDAVGDTCAVALRFAVDESDDTELRFDREAPEIVAMLADLPDLWDVNISGWQNDSRSSRFGEAGHQEPFIKFVKQLTGKPVVGVGRFTSPDAMLSQVKRGVLDLIGAARPSIADPFLPKKIAEGRVEEIRECIGCNICTTGDYFAVPMRCTQNPTMGEEWRKGWHPERIEPAGSRDKVLVVGGGPAGLECALALSRRGYEVVLTDARDELGGRVVLEAGLPGLAEWKRVADHRIYMLGQRPNVQTYLDSKLDVAQILEYGFDHVVIATGANWRTDGVGRSNRTPPPVADPARITGVDRILAGGWPTGRVVVFDDDLYYMANVIAEGLARRGCEVAYVTPTAEVAPYTDATLELARVRERLLSLDIHIMTGQSVAAVTGSGVELRCSYTNATSFYECDRLVPVTERIGDSALSGLLDMTDEQLLDHGIKSVQTIGDCRVPGLIAAAVYSGHQYARQLDNAADLEYGFQRENHQPGAEV